MKYGTVEFLVEYGSITFTKKQRQILRHYIDTDRSDAIHLGKESTIITCNILVQTLAERLAMEQLLHGDQELNLEFDTHYYKRVKPDSEYVIEPADYRKARWRITARFIALDPIPYDNSTGEALY